MDQSSAWARRAYVMYSTRWSALLLILMAVSTPSFSQTGPVGHWKLDENTGTAPQDSSGNTNHCTMSPAPTWTAGKFSSALSFDGVDDAVNCGSGSSLGTLAQFTVSAWINLASAGEGGFGRIVQKGNGSNPTAGWRLVSQTNNRIELSVDHVTTDVGRTSATSVFAWNTWTHVAATWSGTTALTDIKIYINGVEVSYSGGGNGAGARNSDTATPLRIGNTDLGASTVNGKIDDVRVYDRVLSASEIQALADSTSPSAPTGLGATVASSTQINLSWGASTDNTGVTNYLVERCAGAACSNFAQIATPTGTTFSDTGLTASSTYRYQVRATDANGNLSGYSGIVSATTSAPGGSGPVGYWKFDEGSGTAPQDSSGNANHCTMSPVPTWTSGRVNGALTFDGVDDAVNCGSGSSLGALPAMTVSAWVNLASAGEGGFGRLVQKGNGGNPTAGWRLVSQTSNRIEFSVDHATTDVGRTSATTGFGWNTWAHVAATWAGTTNMTDIKIYINGVEASYSGGGSGAGARNSDTAVPLRIGNNDLGAGTVSGKIDEVRVYDRVLSAAEIQALADASAPSVPTDLGAAVASNTQINLSWTASNDNVGVTSYLIERCAGASCTNFVQVGTASGLTYNDLGLSASSTYRYQVRARDANANLSAYSAIASATTSGGGGGGDTQAPTVPGSLNATAASSTQINLSWNASTDNVAVTGYLVERCQGAGCSNFSQIATPNTTTYSDMGRSASTSYSYRVRATDAANNYSAYSSTATATTQSGGGGDTTPPTAPTNLGATPASSTQINLSWTASSDNVGVTGYRLERCQGSGCSNFSQIDTPATTTYSDTGLTALTSYSYRVRATDAAANLSSYSNSATASTPIAGGVCD